MTSNAPLSLWEAVRREMEEYQFVVGLRTQPKWDIPERVAINVAVSGRASAGVTDDENIEAPQKIEEYIEAAASVIEAGATGIHLDFTWVVDQKGRRMDTGDVPMVEAYRMVLGPLRKRFGDSFIANLNVLNGKTFEECLEPAKVGFADVAPCAAGHPDAFMLPAVKALINYGVSPEIVVHSSGEIELAKRKLIDSKIATGPLNWIILFGLPFNSGRTLLSGVWVPNARDLMRHLLMMVDQIKDIDPKSLITVCAAGRASLYITTLATMLGLEVRVGTEDTIWRYPNSDDMFTSNLEMFQTAKQIAASLGRRVSTAQEYRSDLKINYRYSDRA